METFWVTGGRRYHRADCHVLPGCVTQNEWTRDEIAAGRQAGECLAFRTPLTPCRVCAPEVVEQAEQNAAGRAMTAPATPRGLRECEMETLTNFLLQRIAEDEKRATSDHPNPEALGHHGKRADRREKLAAAALGLRCPTCHADVGQTCEAMTPPHHAPKIASDLHATRRDLGRVEMRRVYGDLGQWSVARVLAECAAKRRIVEDARDLDGVRSESDTPARVLGMTDALRVVLTYLAAPYADHPEWREEWAV